LALALFVGAASVLIGAVHASIRSADRMTIEARSVDVAASTLAALDVEASLSTGSNLDATVPLIRGWSRGLRVRPASGSLGALGMQEVEVIITHRDSGYVYRVVTLLRSNVRGAEAEER
jgi:hypothetical protein